MPEMVEGRWRDGNRRGPHPLVAVTLSAIWPGLGHVGHRNRRAAVLAAAALVAAAAGIGYAYRRDMRDLLALAVSRTSLLAVILVSGGLLAARGAVAFDAYRVARRRYPRRRAGGLRRAGAAATLAVLAVLIAAPHLWVARLATAQLTLLAEVFDASDTPSARPTPLPAGSPSRQPDPAGTGPVASVRADRGGTAQPPAAAPAEGGDGLPGGAADGPDSPAGAAPATKIGPEDGSGDGAGASTSTDAATTATDATGRLTTTATDGTATDATGRLTTTDTDATTATDGTATDATATGATTATDATGTDHPQRGRAGHDARGATTATDATGTDGTTTTDATATTAADDTGRLTTTASDATATGATTASDGIATTASDGSGRLTVALLGSDGGYRRTGVRTDTIIVLSINTDTGEAAAFNIPRNWRRLSFPGGTAAAERWFDGYPGLANEIYGLGMRFPEVFGGVDDPAGFAIKSALAQLTGLEIHYYVMVDMVGFVKVIDLFGGVGLQVRESIDDRIAPIVEGGPSVAITVEPGYHRLDGLTALGYVRSRARSTDWHRMTRQRCVVAALVDQVTPFEALARFVTLTGIIAEHVRTDIPLDRMAELIEQADRLDTSRIVTVNFIPPEYPAGDAPIPRVRAAVDKALQGSSDQTNTSLADACG